MTGSDCTPRYDCHVSHLPSPALLDIKGSSGGIEPRLAELGLRTPERTRYSAAGALKLIQPRPSHWLLRAPQSQRSTLMQRLTRAPTEADSLILDVTEAWSWFSIQGPESREVMAVICPLDLDSSVFAQDHATFTEILGIRALLWRAGDGFEWAVERSYAPWMADGLARVQNLGNH